MPKDQEMFFFVADISGYTAYMITNKTESEHAKLSITLLMETLVKKIKLPLKLSKREGDAVFLYSDKPIKDSLGLTKKIFTLFSAFEKKINELVVSNICKCGACQNIDQLKLKVIGHYGKASLQHIGSFKELTGLDVIILHRLLKNHIPSHRYFLLTESIYSHMLIPEGISVSKSEEVYEDVGKIPVYVCNPPTVPESELCTTPPFFSKMKRWFNLHYGKKGEGTYRNLPS